MFTGIISGMPSALGPFLGVLNAANGINPSATQGFMITIAAGSQTITFASLGNQMLGTTEADFDADVIDRCGKQERQIVRRRRVQVECEAWQERAEQLDLAAPQRMALAPAEERAVLTWLLAHQAR